ncbi:acyltransferase domain-containing protein [Schauerella aestuarii]|uniref:acyltransferase domain-containing protein n=1 Tax=Schauerella aestuarii TaxID=2511204 RepID=UPI00136D1E19|nr:acyltransferase domain-containing protein [Achromobacter aestuarii]MYZ44775.1 acyltransferase domain-containing protein [Achromobacter aestuarii]
MTLALLCSGQGHQHPEMFRLTGNLAATQPLFDAAKLLLGWDPRDAAGKTDDHIAFRTDVAGQAADTSTSRCDASTAPAEARCAEPDVFANRPAQVLCTLQALAAHAALRDALPRRLCVAGYSVGELAAWGVAGALPPLLTLQLAADRAAAMDAACHGAQGLLAVRGLDEPTMRALCVNNHAAIAIANPDSAWVVGGLNTDLTALAHAAQQHGASRVTPLRVSVASHTPLMHAAAAAFKVNLFAAPLAGKLAPGPRLFTGIDGAAVFDVHDGAVKLAAQIAQTIHWEACLQSCIEAGATAFLELGPGHALADMAASAYPGIPARSLDAFATLESARAWIARLT